MTQTPPSSAPQNPPQAAAAEKAGSSKPVPDRELLRRFVRLADQAAFAALVRRHSGLVIGVCRRVLRSEHDIEDAFQATFLVLARDAGRIRKTDSLASWLHGVAYRTSLRAADSTRRRGRLLRELTMIEDTLTPADDSGPLADVEQRHQQQALDEELASLPDNYRAALVLHYLDGKSNQQVAEELGLSVTAVEGRLKRGRKELRLRLARRGIGLSVAVAAMQAVQSSAQAAPLEPLIARAIDAGLSYAGGEAAGPVYSPEAARLAGQELMTMSTTTTATLAAVVLLPLALGFAGHAPVAGPTGSAAMISTTLAQADASEAEGVAAEPASNQQADETPSQDEPVAQLISVDEWDGHITIKYRTADGEVVQRLLALDEDHVSSALKKMTSMEFVDTPLSDAAGALSKQHHIMIVVDEVALTEAGLSSDVPVNVAVNDVTLESALKAMLEPLKCAAYVEEGFLKVTTLQHLAERAANAQMVDPAHQSPATAVSNDSQTRWAYVDPLTGSTSAPAPGAGYGMEGGMSPMGRAGGGATLSLAAGDDSAPGRAEIRDYADIPASEQKIADRLKQPTSLEFVDTPLSDAIDFISDHHEIPILIDETALTDVGIPTDEPVNLILRDVTLQTAFNLILRPLGCTTIIRDEVLQVTTKDVADEYLMTRVYDISDLAGIEQEQLLKVLQESLPDAEWKESDGGGGTASILDDALVVKQSQSAHHQIVDLLGQLRRHMQQRSPSGTSRVIEEALPSDGFELSSADAAEAPPTTKSSLQGLVTATRTGKSGDVEFVEISVGSDDGVLQGAKVGIYRRTTRPSPYDGAPSVVVMAPVGQIEIVYVTSKRAVGRVTSAMNSQLTIERGDQVVWAPVDRGKAVPGHAVESAPGKELTLHIDADGNAHHDGELLPVEQLQKLLESERPTLLLLRVDHSASSAAVSGIIDAAKAAGIPELKFALRVIDSDTDDGDPEEDVPAEFRTRTPRGEN